MVCGSEGASEPGATPTRRLVRNQLEAALVQHLLNEAPRLTAVNNVVAPAAEAGPRPVLHGVVTDGDKSRAYIEDTPGGRVLSYGAGDTVGGGRLERIADDRVTIRRPEGAMEIMLRDSSKPASGPAPRPR